MEPVESRAEEDASDDVPSRASWVVGLLSLPFALYAGVRVLLAVARLEATRIVGVVVPLLVVGSQVEQPSEAAFGDDPLQSAAEALTASMGSLQWLFASALVTAVPLFASAWCAAGRREWARRALMVLCALEAVRVLVVGVLMRGPSGESVRSQLDRFLYAVGPLHPQDAEWSDRLVGPLFGEPSTVGLAVAVAVPLLLLLLAWSPWMRTERGQSTSSA